MNSNSCVTILHVLLSCRTYERGEEMKNFESQKTFSLVCSSEPVFIAQNYSIQLSIIFLQMTLEYHAPTVVKGERRLTTARIHEHEKGESR